MKKDFKCCKECFVPSYDELAPPDYMLSVAMPERCRDEDCDCHTPEPSSSSTENGLVIVPSGRIDYCGGCKKEHGYDCPLDSVPSTAEEWENEFDKKFGYSQNGNAYFADYVTEQPIKDFIRTLLTSREAAVRREERERIRTFLATSNVFDSEYIYLRKALLLQKFDEFITNLRAGTEV